MDFRRYKIVFSPTSKRKIKCIYEYIAEELLEKRIATKIMKKILQKINELEFMPNINQVINPKDKNTRKYRKLIVENYVIIYSVKKKKVYIDNIFHERNDYLNQKNYFFRNKY